MNRKHQAAFTLVELLAVIAIIAVLAALTVGAAKYAATKSASSRAKAEIVVMENALEQYKQDKGYYPLSTEYRDNATTNSILLYTALTAGSRQYFEFKKNQVRDGGNNITVTITCPTSTYTLTVTNVAIIDPFGHPYNYFQNCGGGGRINQATFDLWSYGPNGTNDDGVTDDITNWQQ